MLGVHYLKSNPTTYVMRYKNGHLVDQGVGLSVFYFAPNSTIVRISQTSQDLAFEFVQQSADFHQVTIEGNLTYHVVAPERLAQQFDFSIDCRGRYQSEDPNNLRQRLARLIQSQSQNFTRTRSLDELLAAASELSRHLVKEPTVLSIASLLGLEIETVWILSIRADPEMTKALQAGPRQQMMQQADEASHRRRQIAAERERQIRQHDLDTEQLVQQRQSELKEAQQTAEVTLERKRAELIEQQVANQNKLNEAHLAALRATFEVIGDVDWRTLVASSGGLDSKQLIAMAFGELAANANKIGRLDITAELLRELLKTPEK